jgi:hypothetical protein
MKSSRRSAIVLLYRQRKALLGELSRLSLLIRGSSFARFSTCSRPNCLCHRGQRHGPRSYVAVMRDGRQKQHYVPREQVQAVRQGVEQYQHLLKIVDELTAVNLQLMRKGALDEPDR